MAFPKVAIGDRDVIIVNGFYTQGLDLGREAVQLCSIDKFYQALKCHPDAVAFGYLGGRYQKWVPAA